MTHSDTTTRVERLRIKTRSAGQTLQQIEDDLRDISSLLLVSAASARIGSENSYADRLRGPINSDVLEWARKDVASIRVVQLRMNTPLNILLEQAGGGVVGVSTLSAVYIIYNRLVKGANKTFGVGDKYLEFKKKRSDLKPHVVSNEVLEAELRDQLNIRRAQTKLRGNIVKEAIRYSKKPLSKEERKEIEQSIKQSVRALRIIESLEAEEAPRG